MRGVAACHQLEPKEGERGVKRKCKCPPDSPFHWMDNRQPSMFMQDPVFRAGAKLSQTQTAVVERERIKGRDISHIAGLSAKTHAERVINVKQFTIYSRAGKVL